MQKWFQTYCFQATFKDCIKEYSNIFSFIEVALKDNFEDVIALEDVSKEFIKFLCFLFVLKFSSKENSKVKQRIC